MNFLYILLAIFIFGVLIFIHELGHFIVARMCGVGILEFSIGMGPKIFSVKSKKSGTRYSIRLFPLGGYVSMLGESGMELAQGSGEDDAEKDSDQKTDDTFFFNNESEPGETAEQQETQKTVEVDPETAKRAYCNQSVWKRILISLAGPFMNILLGFVLMIVMVLVTKNSLGTTVVAGFPEGNTSASAGLQVSDQIVKVGKVHVHTLYDLGYEIGNQGYQPVQLTVIRNGEKIVLENVTFPTVVESSTALGMRDFYVLKDENINFGSLMKHAFSRSCTMVKMVWDSIVGLFTHRFGVDAITGPVGITGVITDAAKTSGIQLLHLIILISINLGVMNLLPLPALDGGHIFLYIIEAIRRKPIKPEVEGIINFVGLALLMLLAVIITIKDIIAL